MMWSRTEFPLDRQGPAANNQTKMLLYAVSRPTFTPWVDIKRARGSTQSDYKNIVSYSITGGALLLDFKES